MDKILLVNTRHYYGGGDSNYTFNLADLLRSKGHEVSFFAMQDARNQPDPNKDLFVTHINYREINRKKNLLNGLKVMGRAIYSREARNKFSKLLDRVKPDIVHLQNIHAHITPSIIFEAKKRRLPVVWTLHDYKLVCPNSHFLNDATAEICEACRGGKFWQTVRKRCKKGSLLASGMAGLEAYIHAWLRVRDNVDAFLSPSDFLKSKLLENSYKPQKVFHLPLFLPLSAFSQQASDDGYILFLGKLEPLKGIYTLIEAARKAPHVPVILAGNADEPILGKLPSLLPPNVKYAGFKTGDELTALKRGARAFVLPSLWYENQPLSILEAFALGKPVVASNLGGMRELVGDNERGLLVSMGDVDGLVRSIQRLHENQTEAHLLGERAYRYVLKIHSPEAHYLRLTSIYKNLF